MIVLSDKEKDTMEDNDEIIVVMTDEDGNEFYYREEMILPVGEDKYALLVPTHADDEDAHEHEDGCGCGCGCEDDEDAAFFAKIVLDEKGEEEYIEPSDEEFEAVCKAYDKLMEDEDSEDEE